MTKTIEGIAIVGMDCRYPGAQNLNEYWENILALRQNFRRIPSKRFDLNYYLSKDGANSDSTYSEKAAVLNGYNFDRVKYKVGKSTFEQTDFTHWLALDVAAGALKDAGFENGIGLDKTRVGVIIGNSLTGEFTRANLMRLRWPYVLKVLESGLKSLSYEEQEILKVLSTIEAIYKSPFPEPTADTLAGGLSNTIAGRICNYFDFNGGGFTVDGACASSLLAFANGCDAISNEHIDVAIVGGVDLSIDPFELIGFARNGALAVSEMEVYSAKSEGFWPGEGCGLVVLMKESEARKQGLRIYSIIKGWGISSDGNGGITRPKSETQQLAFERAYKMAGYGVNTVSMFEGHGTGTPLGDKVEITAIVNALKNAPSTSFTPVLGSVKHLIGHTKAAAGVAGVIKAALALRNGIIPASRANALHPLLQDHSNLLRLAKQPQVWNDDNLMRASVSSMGFGGINVHMAMEQTPQSGRKRTSSEKILAMASSVRDVEIIPLSAHGRESLIAQINNMLVISKEISRAEFIDMAATLCESFKPGGKWRLCLVAKDPDSLYTSLLKVKAHLDNGQTQLYSDKEGIFLNYNEAPGEICFLFPGQGAPIYNDYGAFNTFISKRINGSVYPLTSQNGAPVDTAIAQPHILEQTLMCVECLEDFGVEASFGIGHSLGEISALSWAGVYDAYSAYTIAKGRGNVMSTFGEKGGALLALKCDEETLFSLLRDSDVHITGYNGVGNYVVGGRVEHIEQVQERALQDGINNVRLKVSHAFHTPMMKNATSAFAQFLDPYDFNILQREVISTITGNPYSNADDVKALLVEQIEAPVLFTQAIENIKQSVSLFVEVGPGSALQKSLHNYEDIKVVAADFGSQSFLSLFNVLASAFVTGSDIRFEELVQNRFYRKFDVDKWVLDVLQNPCEKLEFVSTFESKITKNETADVNANMSSSAVENSPAGITNYLKQIISEKTEIPVTVLNEHDKIMSQLHINSLAITEMVSLAVKAFRKSQKVFSEASICANSDGSIKELAEVLFKGEASMAANKETELVEFDTLPNWTHVFKRIATSKKAVQSNVLNKAGTVYVKGSQDKWSSLVQEIAKSTIALGTGGVYIYSSADGEFVIDSFLEFINSQEVRRGDYVLLVDVKGVEVVCDLKPFLRTFKLEALHINASSVEIDETATDISKLIIGEIKNIGKYKEVIYKGDERFESEITPVDIDYRVDEKFVNEHDIVLATGGGKGITFISIFELIKESSAQLIIIGRADAEKDAELNGNLSKLTSIGARFQYFQADITDERKVCDIIETIRTTIGNISICVHGAGHNKPKTLNQLLLADVEHTHAVKVGGLKNVLKHIDPHALRLLVGFGSIIGESGMYGNSDYAYANNALSLFIKNYQRQNLSCRCINLEWSVWDEVGMGVNMNILSNLKSKGVWPIPFKVGVKLFVDIIQHSGETSGDYIITGRYGNIPTLNFVRKKFSPGRFVGKTKYYMPGVEIVSDVNVNLKDDLYLKNHVFNNQYIFPTVMVLEGLAQLARTLQTEPNGILLFRELKINKSIFIPSEKGNVIRFSLTKVDKNTFKGIVKSEDSNFEVNCFEVLLDTAEVTHPLYVGEGDLQAAKILAVDVNQKFYDDLLFHTGPFRRIKSFLRIQADGAIAISHTDNEGEWFSAFVARDVVTGDPGLNDAAIHCHQACRPGFSLLPTSAGRIYFNNNVQEGPYYIETTETAELGNETTIDVYVFNQRGDVKICFKDLVLTRVAGTSFKGTWDPHFLAPHIEYNMKKIFSTLEESVVI